MRSVIEFDVAGARCAATIDSAAGSHALLIVSGGNEIRSGAHRGMARLAALVADAGHPVLRFDRRGVGDSEGDNHGFASAAADIAAAAAALRSAFPQVTHITAFGNCDAAAALALFHQGSGVDALILANPWTIDTPTTGHAPADSGDDKVEQASAGAAALPPAAAIRARYLSKLKDPGEWLRLLGGGVNIGKLLRGLRAAGASVPSQLGERIAESLHRFSGPMTIVIAQGDGTAQAFMGEWQRPAFAPVRAAARMHSHPTTSHSFADDDARAWLDAQILAALAERG